jgi:hypothetical protein
MHPCQSKYHTFCLAAVYVSHSVTSPIFSPLGNHDTKSAISCVFTCVHPPGDYHTCSCCPLQNITTLHTSDPLRTASIVMVRPKHHTTKEVMQKVASTHSPPTAPDVAKKRKPPKIRNNIPWSPTKVVRRKLAPPPNTTIDLTHLKEMSPHACSVSTTGASTNTHSKGMSSPPTCSVAAAASTNLYCQLYSADSADDKDNNDEEFDIHKHINKDFYEDYDDILDMDIDSKEEFLSSFPKNYVMGHETPPKKKF